jgi:D-beta-D-heptose 7-phosphate kinase/D-beta-D-heptose 1-phosphate adenosyltransferase
VSGRLVVVGDALLDRDVEGRVDRLCPEAPVPVLDERERRSRPGGAGLAAAFAAADGRPVTLVTALADDAPGRELRYRLERGGVELVDLGLDGATPTKVRFRCDGHLLLRLDNGAALGTPGSPTSAARAALEHADAILVSDYGRGLTAQPRIRAALKSAGAPIIWDPHPRGAQPVHGVHLATPNRAESKHFVPDAAGPVERARFLLHCWQAEAVAVTLGSEGALLVNGTALPIMILAPPADGDPCGAGDRFASAVAGALADGRWLPDAVADAVACASDFVREGGASAFAAPEVRALPAADDVTAVIRRVRSRGGKVVGTGGCFDLLHAGHVSLLEAARSLGDCLIVCLNSDESVRRLKGSDRPLVTEDDRAAVLRGLSSVDGVVVFDDPTPAAVLERLRPDIWAKGGDYALEELPEAEPVAGWGGEVVILPYVEGRSTTRLLKEIAVRAAR